MLSKVLRERESDSISGKVVVDVIKHFWSKICKIFIFSSAETARILK